MRILYDSRNAVFKEPFGTLDTGEECRISVHIPSSCRALRCGVVFERENGEHYKTFAAQREAGYVGYDVFTARFKIDEAGLYFYSFLITTEKEEFPLFKYGNDMTNIGEGTLWQLSCVPADFRVPDCIRGGIMYQIFPDRFNSCGLPACGEKLKPYFLHVNKSDIPVYLPDKEGKVHNCDFFGGNFKGIAEKLPYLAQLSVSMIYLNPIFKAYSNHRYDTADYMKPDEMLGTEEDFSRLCERAHELGMRVILDGVFSHTGDNSVYFDKYGQFGGGAYSDEDSPYREWFRFEKYPDKYACWWGIDTLPTVNKDCASYRDFIYGGSDSVAEHWLRLGADGFRLDVADELPDDFIYGLRQKVKQIKPDALVIGEVWEDASNKVSYGKRRTYFTGAELDSVMNYPLRRAVIDFVLGKDDGEALEESVMSIAENYPERCLHLLMNFLSTHDTERILSVLGPRPEDKEERAAYKMDGAAFADAFAKLRKAVFLQFIMPGLPCIYYGDEIGMEGFEDPFCRKYFEWDRAEGNPVRDFYIKMTSVRRESEALKYGSVRIDAGDGQATVTRKYGKVTAKAYISTRGIMRIPVLGKVLFSEGAAVNGGDAVIFEGGMLLTELTEK